MRTLAIGLAVVVALSACSSGTSTAELEEAAKERARQALQLPANAPLEATAWVGEEYDGDMVVCGTVSGTGSGTAIPPKRFAAHTSPIEWIHFENAHDTSQAAQPDKFVTWFQMCGNRGGAGKLDDNSAS